MRRYLLVAAIAPTSNLGLAQVPESQAPVRNLTEYEGHYEYHDGGTLFMVASGERLIAIIGESKYALRAAGTDTFTNAGGDPLPFLRDTDRRIVAFKEKGVRFGRLSSMVPAATRLLLESRPRGPDGRTITYHYARPVKLPDGIRTGEAGPGTLPRSLAERLVNGVINGTYPDVRSILVYQKGALLLEEYFYGYGRERPHQMRSLTKSVISLLVGTRRRSAPAQRRGTGTRAAGLLSLRKS